ncbi:MAG: coproporphyrinogen dehydrogenase HemZ [Ruminococcaceae bacterium]|nr:coproporphyrinogen dehydrogenase HemZ [Oscillospiraceae bacterium]
MHLYLRGNDFHFELENVSRLFLPLEKIYTHHEEIPDSIDGLTVECCSVNRGEHVALCCRVRLDGFDEALESTVPGSLETNPDDCELELCTLLYHLLVKLLGFTQGWGLITGVRPVKLLRRLTREMGPDAARTYFRDKLLVSDQKRILCETTLLAEDKLLALSQPKSFSLYVSIPFCPTRCDYCSFVSQTVVQAKKLIPTYVEQLCQEIAYTGRLAKELGLRLETVYFGGGTPTTLSAEQLTALFKAVEGAFDLSTLREYTVEAGRPDTVTPEKMAAIHAAGVGRVSINPQTLQPEVLAGIGRKHTVEQFYDAFDMARKAGFTNINTDLIAGLPGDDYEGFSRTIEGVLSLAPESITVHTLSMKRASNIMLQKRPDYGVEADAVRMVKLSAARLPEAGYAPYYLYRQSRTVGNQENVGWAKPGYEGLYNVYIMDETHTILGCGAGAVSKLKQPGTDYLERIFNYKFPYEYNTGLEEMLARKNAVPEFYHKYCEE